MSENPYAPPNSRVADVLPQETTAEPPFFAVSLTKLVLMSICTFGLYEVYWFYRNWKCIKGRERSNISPALRAIFAVFYCYQCFARIRAYDIERNGSSPLSAGLLAIGWIITTLLSSLPDPYWWISLLSFVFILPVQSYANRLNAQASPSHNRNASLRSWNWVALILGGALLLLALAETFLLSEGK
jgi:hypothetical protein